MASPNASSASIHTVSAALFTPQRPSRSSSAHGQDQPQMYSPLFVDPTASSRYAGLNSNGDNTVTVPSSSSSPSNATVAVAAALSRSSSLSSSHTGPGHHTAATRGAVTIARSPSSSASSTAVSRSYPYSSGPPSSSLMTPPPQPTLYARYKYDISGGGGGHASNMNTPIERTVSPSGSGLNDLHSPPPVASSPSGTPSSSSTMAFDPTLGFHYASAAQQQQQRIGSHPADRSNMDAQGRTILATPSKHPRLICLDALRGVAIMAMIVSKDSSSSGPSGYVFRGALAPSPWQGLNFADFVSPLFMFIVGASLPLSSTARCISSSASSSTPAFLRRRIQWAASRRVVWRSLQLFAVGLVLEGPGPGGLPNHIDLEHLRLPGTLQQIAFVYAVTALVHIWIPQRTVAENDEDVEDEQQQQHAPQSAATATATATSGSRSSSATASTASALAAAAASSSNYNSNSNGTGTGSSGNNGGRIGGQDSAENSLGSSSGPSRTTTSARPSLLARTRCFMLRTYAWHLCFALLVLAVYLSLLLGVSVPGCSGGGGVFSPGCNSGRWLDERLFGSAHMDHRTPSNLMRLPECSACSPAFCPLPSTTPPAEWCSQPFEPLGLLATIGGSLLISLGGLMFGHVLAHVASHRVRLRVWVQMGAFVALPLGLLGHLAGVVPATPQLGTTSFALITLGTAGGGLAGLYALLEAPKQMWREKTKRVFHPVICMGMNSLLVYVLAVSELRIDRFISFVHLDDQPSSNLIAAFQTHVLVRTLGANWGGLAWPLVKIACWLVICTLLAKRRTFWKL